MWNLKVDDKCGRVYKEIQQVEHSVFFHIVRIHNISITKNNFARVFISLRLYYNIVYVVVNARRLAMQTLLKRLYLPQHNMQHVHTYIHTVVNINSSVELERESSDNNWDVHRNGKTVNYCLGVARYTLKVTIENTHVYTI